MRECERRQFLNGLSGWDPHRVAEIKRNTSHPSEPYAWLVFG